MYYLYNASGLLERQTGSGQGQREGKTALSVYIISLA